MCGILGYSAPANRGLDFSNSLKKGINLLHHRGPDNSDCWTSENHSIGIAHARLSILDLNSRSNQPMIDSDNGLVLSFNGEIYNYLELRKELESCGSIFATNSDTEVILKGYAEWGTQLFCKLRGMFAIAIYDKKNGEIVLTRDNTGQKPLFYVFDEDKKIFMFASELKALFEFKDFQKIISYKGLYKLFLKGFCEGSTSIYHNARKLNAGTFAIFNVKNNKLASEKFWHTENLFTKNNRKFLSENKVLDQLESLLFESIELQLRSDTPVGLLLSGGIDSSLIVALASSIKANLNSYTVRFPGYKKYDESKHADLIARTFGTVHHEIEASIIDPSILEKLAYFYDEPIFDTSIIPTFLLSEEISKHCKVAIGGDGGDELFGGYPHYDKLLNIRNKSKFIPYIFRKKLSQLANSALPIGFKGKKTLEFYGTDFNSEYPNIGEFFSMKDQLEIFNLNFLDHINTHKANNFHTDILNNLIETATYNDFKNFLREDILVKVDRASMANSLEIRSPFLDQRLVNFAFKNIPSHMKVTRNNRKILLKKLAMRHLPSNFDFQRKQGFSIPLTQLILTSRWQEYFEFKIGSSNPEIFNHKYAYSLLKKQTRFFNNAERMTGLIFFMIWVEKFNPSFDIR
jgi:asparagine synthase (glutamine-hydrolysing)